MNIDKNCLKRYFLIGIVLIISLKVHSTDSIRITVENSIEGAPLTLGIPFPQGKLLSPDHVRLLDKNGNEIPSQTNQVITWQPIDYSVKWLWVFFFSTGDDEYILEYGKSVRKAPIKGDRIKFKNAQRRGQSSYIDTGPLRFTINKRPPRFTK